MRRVLTCVDKEIENIYNILVLKRMRVSGKSSDTRFGLPCFQGIQCKIMFLLRHSSKAIKESMTHGRPEDHVDKRRPQKS